VSAQLSNAEFAVNAERAENRISGFLCGLRGLGVLSVEVFTGSQKLWLLVKK
jgi:hypothetical protein